jgi:tyrosinase
LPWHRYFVHVWEKALRDECGYTGGQPYWEWSAYDSTPGTNPLFSGPGSIGGNGEAIVHNASLTYVPTVPQVVARIPPGTGGGCVLDGPFANMTNNLGPQGP